MSVTLWHNPKCSTSRKALDLIRSTGQEPTVVEYARVGWDRATLERLAERTGLGLKALLRRKEARAAELLAAGADDETILAAALDQPLIIERPIVETPKGARIGRPVETIQDIL
jgi:arsenate reductase